MSAVLVAVIFDFYLDKIISLHRLGNFACGNSLCRRLFLCNFVFLFCEQTHKKFPLSALHEYDFLREHVADIFSEGDDIAEIDELSHVVADDLFGDV